MAETTETWDEVSGLLGKLCDCEDAEYGMQKEALEGLSDDAKATKLSMQDLVEHMQMVRYKDKKNNTKEIKLDANWVENNLHAPHENLINERADEEWHGDLEEPLPGLTIGVMVSINDHMVKTQKDNIKVSVRLV